MKKFLLTTIAVLASVTLHANDIIVYKQTIPIKVMGQGESGTVTFKGWTIIDFQTLEIAIVVVTPSRHFSVERPEYRVRSLSIPQGKFYGVIKIDDGLFTGMTIKGPTKTIDIFDGTVYSMPTRGTISGNVLSIDALAEFKGSFVFDAANTRSPLNRTVEEKVTLFRQQLIAQGYTENLPLAALDEVKNAGPTPASD